MHISLGTEQLDGRSELDCADPGTRALLATARAEGADVLVSHGSGPVIVSAPDRWEWFGATEPGPAEGTKISRGGFAVAHPDLRTGTSYAVWVQGSFGPGFRLSVDSRRLPDVFGDLGLHSGWRLAGTRVRARRSEPQMVVTALDKPWWQSGWRRANLHGPVAFVASGPERGVRRVPAARSRGLCGRELDWVELV
jgi:hypothetical protein